MMSAKRFKLSSETVLQYQIMDNDTDLNESEVVDLLNKLYEENEKLRFLIDINSVSERRKLERQVDEQQSTIRKLQDLCGKSDGENARLRIENKRLQDEIRLLKPTNIEQYEQIQKLQKELDDCEKFRYQVFKRLNDEYIKERSIK